ncbi:carbon-nitrogen family hydrolase [Allobacillus sp. GCM10007491]|uniref:Carbon-nitrogen family hydrolase n=1 Tax=Allobacillus saliphilus TaxID=2912308 RepID=A0A941HTC8_9BACI|nr:carbon-nitrogen family hydrolase [Allobacillus saliphilus]MBR7553645.1 carbon-nitrogen family hydrolase [Allobacillus saliphilus]
MKFAIYQMEVVAGNPEKNREKVQQWMKELAQGEKPDTIVLPELWTTSYTLEQLQEVADEAGEPTRSFLSELAKEYDVNIVGGSVANKIDGKVYNTSFVFNREGKLVHEYSKIHLVPMLNEPLYLKGGQEKVKTFELEGVKMGVIICYDLRFPELARQLALDGAQVLFVVAEWPTPRRRHWTSLQVARAIENQMYVVSSNNIGSLNGVEYAGASMIIDPWGDVLAQGSDNEEETLTGSLNPDRVLEVRKEVPIFDSRVPHLY